MKNTIYIILIMVLSSCAFNNTRLIADSKWHNVFALQANDTLIIKVKHCKRKNHGEETGSTKTEIRLIKVEPFMDYDSLSDNPPVPPIVLDRTEDTGPLDISQEGSVRIVTLVGGIEVLSRTNNNNAILKIRKLKKYNHGNN